MARRASVVMTAALLGFLVGTVHAHPLDCRFLLSLECDGSLGDTFGFGNGQVAGPFCLQGEGPRFLDTFVYEVSAPVPLQLTLTTEVETGSANVYLLTTCDTDSCVVGTGGLNGDPLVATVDVGTYLILVVPTTLAVSDFTVTLSCAAPQPVSGSTWGLIKSRAGGMD